jgi:hypothetical protein
MPKPRLTPTAIASLLDWPLLLPLFVWLECVADDDDDDDVVVEAVVEAVNDNGAVPVQTSLFGQQRDE